MTVEKVIEEMHGSKLMKDTWRLLITPPAHGAWNMAVDEAILEAVGSGDSLPTLRLYAWEPACLSLGYAQPLDRCGHSPPASTRLGAGAPSHRWAGSPPHRRNNILSDRSSR